MYFISTKQTIWQIDLVWRVYYTEGRELILKGCLT